MKGNMYNFAFTHRWQDKYVFLIKDSRKETPIIFTMDFGIKNYGEYLDFNNFVNDMVHNRVTRFAWNSGNNYISLVNTMTKKVFKIKDGKTDIDIDILSEDGYNHLFQQMESVRRSIEDTFDNMVCGF